MSLPDKDLSGLFKRCHFDGVSIIVCIRWYNTYKLSYRELVAIMAERNIEVAHTTIMHSVQWYVPEVAKCWQRFARLVGTSGRVDETYLKVEGK